MYQSLPGAFDIEGGLWPCAISDGIGNTVVIRILVVVMDNADMMIKVLPTASDRYAVETILRTVTTEMGSRSGVSMSPLSRARCEEYGK